MNEEEIAEPKDLYYYALQESQVGWYENKEDDMPFVKYILSTIMVAYDDFEERISIVSNNKLAIDMVNDAVSKQIEKFKKKYLYAIVIGDSYVHTIDTFILKLIIK